MNARLATMITLGSVLAIAGTGYLAYLLKQDMGEDLTKQLAVNQKLNAQVPFDAKLRNEKGETITFGSLFKGRPVVLMPIFYTCRSACSVELESALKAFRDMKTDTIGRQYDVITVSIHPRETSDLARTKKNEFLKRYLAGREDKADSAERGWSFLTGDQDQVKKITDSVGFKYTYTAEKDRVVHPTALMLLTPQGRVSRYLIGTNYPQPFTRNALLDAGSNVIGEQAQAVSFFGCFTYDPTTGKTMFHVKRAIQIVGAITLLTLILSIISMNRRYKEEHGIKEASSESTTLS